MAPRIPFAFATIGNTTSVPDTSSGTELSWQAGWSPAYELAPEDPGYREIDRGQHNFLWNAITANIKEWQEQTFPVIISTINYPVGSIVVYSGVAYVKFQNTAGATSNPSASNDWKVFNGLNQVENRLKGNQNWNIPGGTGHPLPDATPRDYPVGVDVSYGYRVSTSDPILNLTNVNGERSADSGTYLTFSTSKNINDFFGVKLSDGRIVEATTNINTNGVLKRQVGGGFVEIAVSFNILASKYGIPRGAHKFVGCSELPGVWPDVSDEESADAVSFNKEYASVLIGSAFPLSTHMAGVEPPPTNDPRFRYVKLSSNDSYNNDILINEVVTGTAPALSVTAEINFPSSQIHGQRIELRNTSKVFSRPGANQGVVIGDTIRNFTASISTGVGAASDGGAFSGASGIAQIGAANSRSFLRDSTATGRSPDLTLDASRQVPTSNQNQPVHIEEPYFMRIF